MTSVAAGGTPKRQRPRAARSAALGRQGNLTNSVRLSAVRALCQAGATHAHGMLWANGGP